MSKRRQGRSSYISDLAYGRFYFKALDKLTEFEKNILIL